MPSANCNTITKTRHYVTGLDLQFFTLVYKQVNSTDLTGDKLEFFSPTLEHGHGIKLIWDEDDQASKE